MDTINGWLTPKGDFVKCDHYAHLDIARHPDVITIPRIAKLISELDKIHDDCSDHADREGSHNAEWHIYEMAMDDARVEIWKTLLNHGYIRIGEVDNELHFEGKPNHLKSKYQKCVDFADSYGAKAVFEPQK